MWIYFFINAANVFFLLKGKKVNNGVRYLYHKYFNITIKFWTLSIVVSYLKHDIFETGYSLVLQRAQ
jgi:hypothetical protein